MTASTRALLEGFQEHATLVRAVVEAAGYDEQIAAQWSSIVRRIIDGAALRLRTAGLAPDRAAATATALVWMTERTCYQQAVRNDTGHDDQHIVAAISDVWWNTISAATRPS